MRTISSAAIAALALGFALSGCAATPAPDDGPDPDAVDPAPPTAADCFTGGPWSLDLPDYTEQAQAYLTELGIPVEDLEMTGSQTVQFSADGLMSVETDIVSTGIIATPNGDVPFEVPSTGGGSGDWTIDDASQLTIENWALIPSDSPSDPTVEIPLPDYETISPVGVTCQPGLLSLVSPASPFVPLFHR